jgi:hypothetical protein
LSPIKGYCDGHWETGSEGVMWCIQQDGLDSYDGQVYIDRKDYLEIFDTETGEVVFAGKIDPDYKIGYRPYPLNPEYGQQVSCGMYCHWIQSGFKPDDWGKFFINNFHVELEQNPWRWGKRSGRYRAELYRQYGPKYLNEAGRQMYQWNCEDGLFDEKTK